MSLIGTFDNFICIVSVVPSDFSAVYSAMQAMSTKPMQHTQTVVANGSV